VSPEIQVVVVLGMFLFLLSVGMTVPMAIAIPALGYLVLDGGLSSLDSLGFLAWGSLNSATLTAVPLFILMAELLSASGLSDRVYRGMDRLVGHFPGGLLQTNIAGCAIFSAVSGSSIATAASLGRIALPQLMQRNYSPSLAAGSLAAGGTLGILIPPSIALIVYATFTQSSVPKLFMAALIPGLLLVALFMAYLAIHSYFDPSIAPRSRAPRRAGEIAAALGDVGPFFLLIGGTLGTLYAGIVTTTEAAAIGCLLAAALGATFGSLDARRALAALRGSILMSGNILFIILAAFMFSSAMSFSGANYLIVEFITGLELTRTEFLIAVVVLYVVLGCLVESIGMLVITVPLLFPLLGHFDIDVVLFGVITVLFIEMAQITPPMGINLFVIQGMWDGRLGQVIRGVIPFTFLILGLAIALMIWPQIALWLPEYLSD